METLENVFIYLIDWNDFHQDLKEKLKKVVS